MGVRWEMLVVVVIVWLVRGVRGEGFDSTGGGGQFFTHGGGERRACEEGAALVLSSKPRPAKALFDTSLNAKRDVCWRGVALAD